MKELSRNEFGKIKFLAEEAKNNRALIFSVIEKKHPGRVFVNKLDNPHFALIVTRVNFMFVLGDVLFDQDEKTLSRTLFGKVLSDLEEKAIILFSYSEPTRKAVERIFQKKEGIRISRKQFKLTINPDLMEKYRKIKEEVPQGFRLEKMDNMLGEKAGLKKEIADFSGDAFGFCLLQGEEIASFCYSIFLGGGEAEVDIKTNEKFQGKGLASIVAAAFIMECFQKGLVPNWATWPYREASIALAHKLGFEEIDDIPAHFWAEEM